MILRSNQNADQTKSGTIVGTIAPRLVKICHIGPSKTAQIFVKLGVNAEKDLLEVDKVVLGFARLSSNI